MSVAVVTGAGRGLGAELVRQLRSGGYTVIATDITGADRVLDVTSAAACRDLAEEIHPDVWINCAGVLGAGEAAVQPDAVVENVVAVNVLGVMHGTRAAVSVMRQRGSGHVINIGSLASWVPVPGECVYAATKAAVLSFSLGLQAELRAAGFTDIHISVICPDAMLTPMLTDILDDPAIALSFTGLHVTTVTEVARRTLQTLRRPRRVRSVPRWRGAQVRMMGFAPDAALGLAPLFVRLGQRAQRRILAQSGR
jgi:short-subunit dehydrogenase